MKEEKIWAVKDGYLVNRDGSIYKLNWDRTKTMRKVAQNKTINGYLRFNLNGKTEYVHRFVASCFIPNPYNLPCINHKDENKTNNCIDNLEWCNYEYNTNYGSRNQKAGKHLTNHPNKSKKVFQYTKDGKFVKEWQSLKEIQRVLGFKVQNISSCCNGKLKSYKGFIWRHADSTQQETSLQIAQ